MSATKTKAKKRSVASAAGYVQQVADRSALFNTADSPFHADVSKRAAKLVVVTGDNASGKSLFVRVASAFAQQDSVLPISVSIRERTGAGTNEMSGMRRVMMFGEEQEQSTGATSVGVVKTAFGNLDRPDGSVLILDEPEIGLADSYARAFGQFIGQQTQTIPAKCRGVLVVTHSRALVQGLLDGFDKAPTHVAVAADEPIQAGLEQWLDTVEHRSVEELLALKTVGLERWRQVNKLLDPR